MPIKDTCSWCVVVIVIVQDLLTIQLKPTIQLHFNFDLRSLLLPSRKKKEGKHTTRDDNDNDQVMAVQLLIPTATAQTRTK